MNNEEKQEYWNDGRIKWNAQMMKYWNNGFSAE
jgi:hypothetical protein